MSTATLCRQQDVIQTFVLLKKEKRLLLLQQAEIQQPQHQQQFRQQMNDLNRRLHAVVQRMSARQRYKRKKTTTTAMTTPIPLSPGSQEIEQAQASAQLVPDDIMTRLNAVHTSLQAIIDDLRGDSAMYSELADMLQAGTIADDRIGEEQQQSETRELSESEQFRQSMRGQVMGVMRSRRERPKEMERSHQETEERDRLHQARLDELLDPSDEQASIRLAQLHELHEQRGAKVSEDMARFYRQIAKRGAEDAWRMRWFDHLNLVFERRANQSANAG